MRKLSKAAKRKARRTPHEKARRAKTSMLRLRRIAAGLRRIKGSKAGD